MHGEMNSKHQTNPMQHDDIQAVQLKKCGIKKEERTKQHQGEPDRITVYQNVKRGRKHIILMN